MSNQVVLCINAGSSSLKFAVFGSNGTSEEKLTSGSARDIDEVLRLVNAANLPAPTSAGHRVVHGGADFVEPTLLGARELARLRELVPFAPLHLPASIAGIEAVSERYPRLPQVACFDTAFHASLPERARRLPLPAWLHDEHVRRYGFHGLSCEYALSCLGSPPPARVVIAHLGAGSSVTAVLDGRSLDTTMGFTPTAGVLMGTRTGDLDPGVLFYLLREKHMTLDALEQLVDRESGLKALGGTSDMRELLGRRGSDPGAALAVEMFVISVQKAIAGFVAELGGLDALVFTGGIGENSPEIRTEITHGLAVFGVRLEETKNASGQRFIQASDSQASVQVITADEDLVIARHTLHHACRIG